MAQALAAGWGVRTYRVVGLDAPAWRASQWFGSPRTRAGGGSRPLTGDDQITRILHESSDRQDAAARLLPIVYERLRGIAQRRMLGERRDHTLQATALVHEAYVRMVGDETLAWETRGHFFAAAAEAMRRVLIDHARKHRSAKRGGGRRPVSIDVSELVAEEAFADILALDEAMQALAAEDPRSADLVRLRFYAGLSMDDAAAAMGISPRTAAREWAFARARLFELLGEEERAGDDGAAAGGGA